MWSEWSSSTVTFQLDIHNFHLPKPRSPMEQLPNRVISTVVSPDSRSRARESERGTPGTAVAAVRFDIQHWLIYGAGETVSLLWVFMKRRSWQFSPFLLPSLDWGAQDDRLPRTPGSTSRHDQECCHRFGDIIVTSIPALTVISCHISRLVEFPTIFWLHLGTGMESTSVLEWPEHQKCYTRFFFFQYYLLTIWTW